MRFILLVLTLFILLSSCEFNNMHSKASKEVILPLYGNFSELFMYYLMVNVGNPPLLMTASFDTGSSDFLINDVSCSNCFGGNVSIWYNSSKSSDSQSLKCTDNQVKCSQCLNTTRCGYNVSYGGGMTLDAYAYKDEISFSSQSSILSSVAYFGGIYNVINGDRKQGKFFKKHIQNQKYLRDLNDDYPEGIMGFAYSDLSTLGVKTAFDSIVAQNNDVQNIFSICLRDVGGVLSLGGYGNWSGKNEVMYTPITQKNFFGIFVNDILVEGKSIGVNNNVYNSGSVIVDSGTPFPTLPTVAYPFLKNSFLKICQKTDLVGICRVPANQTLHRRLW
eukprot:TRINITY_DN1612_c0_g1_i2.p1 TRINITY_DN1612_c0_g1~~TRINITY_DN1612_c0_g1_i2.p1  ORF type:complete len:333 (+),score=54.15 TRINITY_DN1612_c0_g1_i2:177-1175(+)